MKIVENLWAVGAPPRTPLGDLTALSQTSTLVGTGLMPPPQDPTPALGLRPRFSALRASFSSLFQQSSFPPMHRVLIKTLIVSIFGAKECIRMQDFVLKIYKKIRGSRLPTPAAEWETFVRTHPCAHLPDAGAPPHLLGYGPDFCQNLAFVVLNKNCHKNRRHKTQCDRQSC